MKKETGCDVRISPQEKTELRKVCISGNIEDGLRRMFELFQGQLEKAARNRARMSMEACPVLDTRYFRNDLAHVDWCEVDSMSDRGALFNMRRDHAFNFKVEVSPNQLGSVIGKRGKSAEGRRHASNCSIKIHPYGEIDIIGRVENIYWVIANIWESIKHMPRRYLQSPLAGRIQHYNHNGPDVEIVVMIPSGSIGVLIGKKGEHITRIRRHCVGVKIEISSVIEEGAVQAQSSITNNVQEYSMDKTMRKVTLRGNFGKILLCLQILYSYF